MKLIDILEPMGEAVEEAVQRAFRRVGSEIKRQYRCTSGPKQGKMVASPAACFKRKDPKKVRHGKKVARSRKGIRLRKTDVAKRSAVSKLVTKMNKRLAGNT